MVLAGGRSRRMGVSKADLILGGETLCERARRILAGAGTDGVFVSGPGGIPDRIPGSGPLGGVHGALRALDRYDAVLFLPCDMPFVRSATLLPLMRAFRGRTLVCFPGVLEPLCALVPGGFAENAENAIRLGHLAVGRLWRDTGALTVPCPSDDAFADWDTPWEVGA